MLKKKLTFEEQIALITKQFEDPLEYIILKFHKTENNEIHTIKLFGGSELNLRTGKVGFGAFTESFHFTDDEIRLDFIAEKVEGWKENGFIETKYSDTTSIFVQIQYDKSAKNKDEVSNLLNLQDFAFEIETQINTILHQYHLGSWFASDMGAGANILFELWDFQKGMEIVLDVLKENNLLNRVIIAQRIYKNENDWDYEVIYPENFLGTFDSY